MTGRDVFKIWAPVGAKWVDWVRPVSFIGINNTLKVYEVCDFTIPNINYIKQLALDTAIIVDLSSYEGVKEGIALAKIGFRPIPLYNGTNEQEGSMPLVDNHAIEYALRWGAVELEKINIANDTAPVFLLDSNRMHRLKMNPSVFDNSWDIYPQDIPSAEYFLKNDIKKIIVRGNAIQKDLGKILYKFQKEGIKILFTTGYEEPREIKIKKPAREKE